MQMIKKLILTAVIFNIIAIGNAQESMDSYKYVIVPKKFQFLKEADKYKLNSLTKFLFNKHGFTAIMEGEEFPDDLQNNRCLAMLADVNAVKGGLFKTKVQVELKNCNYETLLTSKVGESREKEYKVAYNLALRDAFTSFETIQYKYDESKSLVSQNSSKKEGDLKEIEKLQKEIEILKEEKNNVSKNKEIIISEKNMVMHKAKPIKVVKQESEEVLYAQQIDNGFQLINTEPKKVMTLYFSGIPDVFIVKGKDALVYKKEGIWVFTENNGTDLTAKTLTIKF